MEKDDHAARHLHAAATHEQMAQQHATAVLFWERRGDPERAELERRRVRHEQAAAQIERDQAELEERRPPTLAISPPEAAPPETD